MDYTSSSTLFVFFRTSSAVMSKATQSLGFSTSSSVPPLAAVTLLSSSMSTLPHLQPSTLQTGGLSTPTSSLHARLNLSPHHTLRFLTSSAHRSHFQIAAVVAPTVTVAVLGLLLGSFLVIRRRRHARLRSSINTVLSTEAPLVSISGTSRPVSPGLTTTGSRDIGDQWDTAQYLHQAPPPAVDYPETSLSVAYAEIQPREAVLQPKLSSAATPAGDPYEGIVRERMLTPRNFHWRLCTRTYDEAQLLYSDWTA
jgi:hypothetical protein